MMPQEAQGNKFIRRKANPELAPSGTELVERERYVCKFSENSKWFWYHVLSFHTFATTVEPKDLGHGHVIFVS